MTLNNIFHKVRISKLALLLVCFIAQSAIALADNKLYVADVTIAPDNNGPVEVSVCLDNDVSGVTSLSMNIELPAGLKFVTSNYMGKNIISATATSRANGASIIGDPTTGKTSVVCLNGINAGTGAIFTFKVMPNANLGSLGTIKLTNAEMRAGSDVYSAANNNLIVENGKVVKPSTMSVAFSETEFAMDPAETHSVTVSLNKNVLTTVNGFQADVTLPTGWTATITNGILVNSGTGTRILSTTAITDQEGALFTINLKAPAEFGDGPATVKLENIYVTVGLVEEVLNPIELTINPNDLTADVEAANAKLADLKTAAAALAISAEAKAYEAENVKTAVAAAEAAIAAVAPAIAAVEAKIAEGKLSTENKEALADLIAAAEKAVADAQTAIAAAEKAYADQKALDDAAEAGAVEAANAKLADLKTAAAALAVSAEAKAYDAENVKTAVAAAEAAIAAVAPAIEAVEAKIAEGKLSTENKEALAALIAAAEKAIADAQTAIAAAEKAYADQKALDDAAEAGAKASAEASVTALKVAMEEVVILEGAKNYDAENVKKAVADAEAAIAAANAAIKAIEDLIAEGKLATENKVAVAQAILAAQQAVDAAADAAEIANETYLQQRTDEEAAADAAKAKLAELKAAAAALVITEEAKAYEAENVQKAVADAEAFIEVANAAVAAVEAKIAEGHLADSNKEALAAAIAAAEEAIADAQTAIQLAEEAYVMQKAKDEAAALAAAKEALQNALTAAKAANVEGMTEESVKALNDAIAAAEAALASEEATVETLNAAKAALEAAVKGLVLAPVFADGTYYIYNPASGKYLGAGSSWSTHAVINEAGLDYILTYTAADGKYTIDSQVSNGGNSHFLNGEWNDGGAMGWIFAKTADGELTISNGSAFLTVQENGEVLLKEDATVEAAHWVLKTKAERVAELAAATKAAPIDATFLVTAANFSRNDLRNSAWQVSEDCTNKNLCGGSDLNRCAESWHSTFTIGQTIENVPNGIYQMTAQGFWRQDGDNEAVPVFFINDQTAQFPLKEGSENSMTDASNAFSEGKYNIEPIQVTVEDGVITLGVKNETNTTIWCIWDNFRLSYLGEADGPDDEIVKAPEGWTNLVANGNLAGDLNANYFSKEAPSSEIKTAAIVAGAGKGRSHGIVVKSADNPSQAWDTQFWIKFNETLTTGSKLHVEFDYAASKAAKATTQAHGAPGDYQHWAAIGDVNFTTEWQHFSKDIDVTADMATGNNGKGLISIAFNLAEEKSATEYYFDNFGAWAQIAELPKEWKDIMVNGNMEGESMECFYVTEQGVGGPFVAIATDGIGKNGSKAVKVQSADSPANNWDTQFFIRLPYQLPAGTQYKVSFDYKADKAGDFETQSHANPGQYIHWACCGGGSFTTDWQTFTAEGAIPSECDGTQAEGGFLKIFQSIAFNLALNKAATQFIFDNVKFEIPKDVADTLTPNPDENAKPYPNGIQNVKNEMNVEGIYNLNGQKMMKTQKGLYIMNGKKVVIK
ncbi:hypothetical protein M1D30_02115 [Prevotella sp. E15-22]|uniref:hypothetical protein n=1 Tax=Prevotella sp. E15-22 TaxID=2937774 RepID=UPI00206764D4|nr:hypothetical protein [Prevotella sp. E15-22]UPS44985.1 hypothetical protein M1D30_02115 [Prevotella sp. E15-22]